MIRPGRKSAASFVAPIYGAGPERIKPPADMDEKARQIFLDLVTAATPEHFQAIDAPLLRCYAEAIVQAREAGKIIGADIVNAPRAALKAQEQAHKAIIGLAMRLRVSPQARQAHKSRRSKTDGAAPSYYDRLRLEASREAT